MTCPIGGDVRCLHAEDYEKGLPEALESCVSLAEYVWQARDMCTHHDKVSTMEGILEGRTSGGTKGHAKDCGKGLPEALESCVSLTEYAWQARDMCRHNDKVSTPGAGLYQAGQVLGGGGTLRITGRVCRRCWRAVLV